VTELPPEFAKFLPVSLNLQNTGSWANLTPFLLLVSRINSSLRSTLFSQ